MFHCLRNSLGVLLLEIGQTEEDKRPMISHVCGLQESEPMNRPRNPEDNCGCQERGGIVFSPLPLAPPQPPAILWLYLLATVQ